MSVCSQPCGVTDREGDGPGLDKQELVRRAACLEGSPGSSKRPWGKEEEARGTFVEFSFS